MKLSCDPGSSSKRAQKQTSLPARARIGSETRSIYLERSSARPNSPNSQYATNEQIDEGSSYEHSSLGTSGSSSSVQTPSQENDSFEQCWTIDVNGQAPDFFSCASGTLEVNDWQRFQDHYISQSWEITDHDVALAQHINEDPITEVQDSRSSAISSKTWYAQLVQLTPEPEVQILLSPGLLFTEPSNFCIPDRMTHYSDTRIDRLWGNHRTFAETEQVSDLFARTVSSFFGTDCRRMARMASEPLDGRVIANSEIVPNGLGSVILMCSC